MSSTRIAEAKGILFLLLVIGLLAVVMTITTGKFEDIFGVRLFRGPNVAGKIAFVSDRNGHNDIWVMNRDGSEQKALTNDKYDDHSPVWSPDGTEIVFISDRDNGRYQLYAVTHNGKRIRKVSQSTGTKGEQVFSPDGEELAFLSSGKVAVREVDGQHEHQVLPSDEQVQAAANNDQKISFAQVGWCASGNWISAVNKLEPGEAVMMLDMSSHEAVIPKDDQERPLVGQKIETAWSKTGQRLAVAAYNGPEGTTIGVLDLDRESYYTLLSIGNSKQAIIQPDWSPDDSSIVAVGALVKDADSIVPEGLILTNTGDGNTIALDKGLCENPKWSYDNKSIAYSKTLGSKRDILTIDVDSHEIKNLTGGKGNNFDAYWAPGPAKD